MADGSFRVRIRFEKSGRLRWLSHLEVMRAFERTVRRADLPYTVTRGFNPRMKHAFGPALPVGTGGTNEYVDLWLRSFVPPTELMHRLVAVCSASLAPQAAVYVSDAEPSLSAVLELANYETRVESLPPADVRDAVEAFVAAGVLQVPGKKGIRTFDLGEVLAQAPVVRPLHAGDTEAVANDSLVTLIVRIGERGSMRPDAFLRAALDAAGVAGGRLVTTRTGLAIPTADGPVAPMPV